ncbi:hypothetical protein EUTSA_v10015507mg [Eutrema salsugineum]|uniref:Uncharacterized protein n=1 Tax=Eutrema salsugineum TaxID=72664 RepID=V4N9I4_EUTSA|nr:subtilisin-like protease SBT4.4 [Eutrema salsugineum]ESQ42441.1 hypothetical protein EUTSA_v10015507mg [Eutrema salsugineum]
MAKGRTSYCLFSCLLVLFMIPISATIDDDEDQQVYIVYLGTLPSREDYTPMSDHMSILQEVAGESSTEKRLVRSYKRSFNGFAARLTESQRKRIAGMERVVSVFPSRKMKLQTTSSWNFMGLKEGNRTKRRPSIESDTIIGVIDTGIWPESESFSDHGFGPSPKKWKGTCAGGKNFTCNNKIIGARYYTAETNGKESARDYLGHGTHTASTAAGNAVADTNFYGLGNGTARGGVPAARIAVYKVCDDEGCSGEAIMSAFDDAIADGVDIVSISIVLDNTPPFEEDPIAIGAFHALAKGVLTVNSAGNDGPKISTVTSTAPWVFIVAASVTNRAFMAKVVLGDGKTLVGRSVNTYDLNGVKYPLVYGKSAALSTCNEDKAKLCEPKCLDQKLVKGKIVLCDSSAGPIEAQKLGAVGSIVKNPEPDHAYLRSFPVSFLSDDDYKSVVSYMKLAKEPIATVLKSEEISNQRAPLVVSFSSRGPSTIVSDILKPDITAPGVEILAAYSPDSSPTESKFDTRRVKFSVLSGTSMACPHVAGVAAYVKTFNPKWSPSMIQSAIMTTAWPMNASCPGFTSTEFAYGAGHVDPIAAISPGLVYESTKADHIAFLCGLNYTSKNLRIISGDNSTCTEELSKNLPRKLNYPTMSAKVSGTRSFKVTFQRIVTNVGTPNSTYIAKVVTSPGSKLSIQVSPSVLFMKSMNEKQSFTVTVSGDSLGIEQPVSANLIWSDGSNHVRSPIVVYAMS